MTPLIIFLLGAVGALAPEIVRLYNLKTDGSGPFSVYYVLVSLAFSALGGLIAVILPATTLIAAFYAGISTPVVVNSALRQATKSKSNGLRGPSATTPDPMGTPARSPARRFVDAL